MMTMAVPRAAPPTSAIAQQVVSVNSSMLTRVPGPAEREAIQAAISANGYPVTRRSAWTSGPSLDRRL
jgi:hypothetical protein